MFPSRVPIRTVTGGSGQKGGVMRPLPPPLRYGPERIGSGKTDAVDGCSFYVDPFGAEIYCFPDHSTPDGAA